MKSTSPISAFWLLAATLTLTTAIKLNITAIGTSNGKSTLECWQLDAPFEVSNAAGTKGSVTAQLGDVASASFLVVPADFDGGLHNAPVNQWVMFTSGLAHITVSGGDSRGAYIEGGEFGLIFAADIVGLSEGHYTTYPGITETTGLQIPTRDGSVPAHQVVRSGPCQCNETEGLKALAAGP
ncbi:hypothetical protein PG988_011507 [Apiospora saccharicola]